MKAYEILVRTQKSCGNIRKVVVYCDKGNLGDGAYEKATVYFQDRYAIQNAICEARRSFEKADCRAAWYIGGQYSEVRRPESGYFAGKPGGQILQARYQHDRKQSARGFILITD